MTDSERNKYPALVVDIRDNSTQVIINRGSENGIKEGELFLVYIEGSELFDPESKESLGKLEIVRGVGYASHVQEKITTITSNDTKRYDLKSIDPFNTYLFGRSRHEKVEVEIKPFNNVKIGDLVKPI